MTTNPTPDTPVPARMDRRSAIKWMLGAAATVAIMDRDGVAAEATKPAAVARPCAM
jgi:hypothetical protein